MTRDKIKSISLNDVKGGSVILRDNASTRILGKVLVSLDNEKGKDKYVLFVEGSKHDILSVSQMVDNGHEVIFSYKGCKIRKEQSRILMAKANRTSRKVYVLNKGKGTDDCMSVLYLLSY